MRTRAALAGVLVSISILVIGWQIGASNAAQTTTTSLATPSGSTGSHTTPTTTGSGDSAGAATAAPTTTAASSDGTWTGSSVSTRFGSVQVQLKIANRVITDVTALQLTDSDGRSVQISNRAAPILQQEVLASQSANVQNVGGATYTSQAYLSSVQSALDQAGL